MLGLRTQRFCWVAVSREPCYNSISSARTNLHILHCRTLSSKVGERSNMQLFLLLLWQTRRRNIGVVSTKVPLCHHDGSIMGVWWSLRCSATALCQLWNPQSAGVPAGLLELSLRVFSSCLPAMKCWGFSLLWGESWQENIHGSPSESYVTCQRGTFWLHQKQMSRQSAKCKNVGVWLITSLL